MSRERKLPLAGQWELLDVNRSGLHYRALVFGNRFGEPACAKIEGIGATARFRAERYTGRIVKYNSRCIGFPVEANLAVTELSVDRELGI